MDNDYVIIVGASSYNSGAESMTYIATKLAKKRWKNCKIVWATSDKIHDKSKDVIYMPYTFPSKINGVHGLENIIFKHKISFNSNARYEKIIRNTKGIIDVSGFNFTTKFGLTAPYDFLYKIYVAKSLNIPFIIMPQSFGPIYYENPADYLALKILMKLIFTYPELICARERAGYQLLKKYCNENLYLTPDMVLMFEDNITDSTLPEPVSIYRNTKKVCIVPNENVITKTNNGNLYVEVLNSSIVKLLQAGYEVHLVAHCKYDILLCKRLKNMNPDAILHDKQMTNEDFSIFIQDHSFIIASRYHSIVHAYRNGIPSIVLGWEDKYADLLNLMKQRKYLIDCRYEFNATEVTCKIIRMTQNYLEESKKLKKRLKYIREKYSSQCFKSFL